MSVNDRLPPPPDFRRVVADLEAHGITRRMISKRIDVSQSEISRWARGVKRPNWKNGSALLDLAANPLPRPRRK